MDWLDLLQIADSAFPTGAFAHSSGLESLAPVDLRDALEVRIQQALGRFELVFVRCAYEHELAVLDTRLHAMLLPREARQASAAIGTALLRATLDLVPAPRARAFLEHGRYHHQAVAFGALAQELSVPWAIAAQGYALGALRGQVSAAQRLGWIGQRDAQRIVHTLKPALRAAIETANTLELDDAGAFAPAWDVAAMHHETARVRMFAS